MLAVADIARMPPTIANVQEGSIGLAVTVRTGVCAVVYTVDTVGCAAE